MWRVPSPEAQLNVTEGEFHFDLYTLGPNVLSQLWEYTRKIVDV